MVYLDYKCGIEDLTSFQVLHALLPFLYHSWFDFWPLFYAVPFIYDWYHFSFHVTDSTHLVSYINRDIIWIYGLFGISGFW